ncbi:MAG: YggT family protein [Candidatus Eisenbacteria bacterium]|nr:YggT family protein [Candidatus Eisenbacteria bacterium]
MFVIGNLVQAVAGLLDVVFQALSLILIVNAVLSWVRPDPSNPIVAFLDRVSDVTCAPVRRLFPTVFSGMDFAPLIMILLLQFAGHVFIVQTLRDLALKLG